MQWTDLWVKSSILSTFLTVLAFLVGFYYFNRVRMYRIHHHKTPGSTHPRIVDSPHAKFVKAPSVVTQTSELPSPWSYTLVLLKRIAIGFWCDIPRYRR